MKPELITVVIPCYNARQYIGETLESVFDQRVSLEIVLVDDGSQDGSADLVATLFPAVKVYRTTNQGPSAARDFGTTLSNGEFIQYLDADDLLGPNKLRVQMEALQESNSDVAYGDWLKFTSPPCGSKEVKDRFSRTLGQVPELDLFKSFWCPPATYLLRRSIVDKVGGWNRRLPVIQDARFMLDCALQGGTFVYCPGIMAEYRLHESGSVSTSNRAAFLTDCLRNALEVRDWWTSRGQLDRARRKAVIEVLDMVANATVDVEPELFQQACRAIGLLLHQYPNGWPLRKRIAITMLGYRSSVTAAHHLRRCRSFASPQLPHRRG